MSTNPRFVEPWKFRSVFFTTFVAFVALYTIAHLLHPNMHQWMPPIGELLQGVFSGAVLVYFVNRLLCGARQHGCAKKERDKPQAN